MARPSERIIREHDLITQFKEKGIVAIFNLQQAGEHAGCGDGLVEDGSFSYCVETFIDAGISFYNFPWKDMTTPTIQLMMNAVQVMAHVIETGGKIAVHCHAGLGRTGLVIACYLVYALRISAYDAVQCVRLHRPGSVQVHRQEAFVIHFHLHVTRLRRVFAINQEPFSLPYALLRQREYLHGNERRQLLHLPKIVHDICKRLATLPKGSVATCFAESEDAPADVVSAHKKALNDGDWSVLEKESDARVLAQLLLHWLQHLREPVLTVDETRALIKEQHSWTLVATLSPASRAVVMCLASLVRLIASFAPNYKEQVCHILITTIAPNSVHGACVDNSEMRRNGSFTNLARATLVPTTELKILTRFMLLIADADQPLPSVITPRQLPRLVERSRSSSLILARSLRRPSTASMNSHGSGSPTSHAHPVHAEQSL